MIEREFLNDSADRLLNNMKAIETCIAKLTPEQIWWRHSEKENAIGNLMLHLAGNLRQQRVRVHHHAVADHRRVAAKAEDALRRVVEFKIHCQLRARRQRARAVADD